MASKLRNKENRIKIPEQNILNLESINVTPNDDGIVDLTPKNSKLRNKKSNRISLNEKDNNNSAIYDTKNYALETLSNVIPSTGQYIKDVVTPFLQPVETYKGVKSMFNGFKELGDREKYIKANPNKPKPPLTKNMIVAEAVNKHFAERYGDWVGNETDDWSVIGSKFADTFRKDPAGVMGDISGVLSLGTIGMAKYAGKAGKIAQNVAKYSDPIVGSGALIGRGGATLSSIGTGKSADSFKTAYNSAASDRFSLLNPKKDRFLFSSGIDVPNPFKSSSNKAFNKAIKGDLSPTEILSDITNKTKLFRTQLSNNYGNWVNSLPDSPNANLKSFEKITKELNEIKFGGDKPLYKQKTTEVDIPNPEGLLDAAGDVITTKGTKTQNIKKVNDNGIRDLNKVEKLINPYLNNIELQTPKSLATLKTELSNLNLNTNKFNKFKGKINNAIKLDLNEINPNTTKIMDDYSKMSGDLNSLDSLIKGNIVSKANPSGLINKIFPQQNYTSAIKKANEILGDLGKNKLADEISSPILKKIGSELKPALAGLDLQNLASRNTGLLGGSMLITKAGSDFAQGSPLASSVNSLLGVEALALPFTMPKIMGKTANLLGTANRFGLGTSTGGRGISLLGNPLSSATVRPYPLTETDKNQINYSLFNNKPYRGLFQ
jgi:hypothetical protein